MIPRNLVTRRLTYDCLGLPGSDPPSVPWMAAVDCGSVNNSDAPQKGVRQPPSRLLLWSSAVCCAGACTGWMDVVSTWSEKMPHKRCHLQELLWSLGVAFVRLQCITYKMLCLLLPLHTFPFLVPVVASACLLRLSAIQRQKIHSSSLMPCCKDNHNDCHRF